MIPPLDANGLLPAGVWDCTLEEAEKAFSTSPYRYTLWAGLLQFLADEVAPLGHFPVWINGGFTRRRDYPEDIDIVLDLTHLTEQAMWPIAVPFAVRRNDFKEQYRVDAYVKHPRIPEDLSAFFQYAGPKAAAELQVDPRQKKGILRVHT